jgi:hypothetical protein
MSENNPHAFPSETSATTFRSGMTLRDYFAAKAMQGLLTAEIVGEYSNEHVAEIAFMLADAMLKAREA